MTIRILLSSLLAALLLSGCGESAVKPPAGVVLNRGNVGEPKSLDPQLAATQWETSIAADIMTGLVVDGPDGKPLPGAAESWDVSEDGLTWTFHLRDENWSDGQTVTAGDFVFAWRRLLEPKTAAPAAFILYVVKNAQKINGGKASADTLGARALDDKTLEVRLEHPAPYFAELLTHPVTAPLPRHVAEAKGADWSKPENFVGNGAFLPVEWVANDHVALRKNPRFYDAATVKLDGVNYFPTSDYDAALRRMRAGTLDTQGRFNPSQLDWIATNMPGTIKRVPDLVLFYLAINTARPPFTDVRVREAVNLAFDREAVTDKIRRMGEMPAYTIVPPGVANYPGSARLNFAQMPMSTRIMRARALMQAAGFGPGKLLRATYLTNNSSDNKVLAPAIQQMLKTVFIDAEIVEAEPSIAYQRMQNHDFDLGHAAWIADYNDAYNFLGSLLASDSRQNYSQYRNPAFDALLAKAQATRDGATRGALLVEAERLALNDFPLVPYRYSVTPDLVQPYVKGWIANAKNVNISRWLSIDGRPTR